MTKVLLDNLNTAQKDAVNTIEGPVLVVAGPGTGKTQLLALRAVNILNKTDTLPQNILCLTYTESATRNMHERISQFIGKQAYDIRISTYHGFGSDIIRKHSEFFDDLIYSQPVDNIGQNKIMHEIYDELPASNPLWRRDSYLKDVLGFIGEAKRNLLSPNDVRTIANNNLKAVDDLSKLIQKHLSKLVKIDKFAPAMFEALLVDLNNNLSRQTLPNNILSLNQMFAADLADATLQYQTSGKTKPITSFKNKWLAKDSKGNWMLAGKQEAKKLLGAADIYEQYLIKLKTYDLFDYDDMILSAIEGIKNNPELKYTLQEQYQYIMLDEFQDTNLAQLELIKLLTDNPASNGRPNVLAVGDDDQAIFSFQGADLTNMVRFYNMYKDVKTITLTENWRSHAEILESSKFIAQQIEDRLHQKLGFADKILVAKNQKLPKKAQISRRHFTSDIAELEWAAKEIGELYKKGVNPNEIAVIAPKHRVLEPLVPYLQNKGVPIRYDKRENVFEDPNIMDIIASVNLILALKSGNQQKSDELWPEVLSADHFNLPVSTIWQLSWAANNAKYSKDDQESWTNLMLKDPMLKPIALFYVKLSQIADSSTLEVLLDYIVGLEPLDLKEPDIKSYQSPYFKHHFGDLKNPSQPALFNQLLSNLTVLRQKLREYKSDGPLKLEDFIDFVESYSRAEEKLLNTSPYHESQKAVQLLTAFGAKGLEFEYVFVLSALDDVWGMKARGKNSNISLPQNLKLIRHAGASKDEKIRLFYVALTRAKHTLYITSFAQNYAGKKSTYLEFLDESEKDGTLVSSSLPAESIVDNNQTQKAPTTQSVQLFWQHKHIANAINPEYKELLKPRLEGFQLSATHLNSFTDTVYGGPEAFLLNTILRFPKAAGADGQFGNAYHETISFIHNYNKNHSKLPSKKELKETFKSKLASKDLNTNELKQMLGRGEQALDVFIEQWGSNFTAHNKNEVIFKHEGVFIEEAHLSGNLDYLVIDEKTKTIEVVDFKTGKSFSSWKKEPKLHKYRQQLLFYKLLLNNSSTYKNYTVKAGKLVFVEPDEDGKLIELSLEYNDDEINRLKLLIKAIWQRIINLDFPEISEYSQDLKGIIAFEDWLIENSI